MPNDRRPPATRTQAPTVTETLPERPGAVAPDVVRDRTPDETNRQHFADVINKNLQGIGLSLPNGMDASRFGRLLLTAANTNPDLFKCDVRSFIAAGVGCAQLGLEPNDSRGLAYLIPFGGKVQLVIGYKGMIDLARRSGMVGAVHDFAVFTGDEFEYEYGLEPTLRHRPDPNRTVERFEDLEFTYAVAKIHLPNGNTDTQFSLLSRAQILRARDTNPGSKTKYSPWSSGYAVEMARKTAIRRLMGRLPQTVQVADALATDEKPLWIGDLGGVAHAQPDYEAIDAESREQPEPPPGVDPATGEKGQPPITATATEEQPA